jgi:heme exporter protein A
MERHVSSTTTSTSGYRWNAMPAAQRQIQAVKVDNVTRLYGPTLALRGVSTEFHAGTVTLVEGPNGSGKSTLLSLLSTNSQPTTGRVSWPPFGEERNKVRPLVGWLGHEAGVYPDLTGWENLRWAAKLYGLDHQDAQTLGERLELGAFAKRPVRTMSRGQRQRIALGRALIHKPALLLLDEPTTGLDTTGTARLLQLVREEVQQGAVVVVIAHDSHLADELSAQRLKLTRGKVVSSST